MAAKRGGESDPSHRRLGHSWDQVAGGQSPRAERRGERTPAPWRPGPRVFSPGDVGHAATDTKHARLVRKLRTRHRIYLYTSKPLPSLGRLHHL